MMSGQSMTVHGSNGAAPGGVGAVLLGAVLLGAALVVCGAVSAGGASVAAGPGSADPETDVVHPVTPRSAAATTTGVAVAAWWSRLTAGGRLR